MTSPAIDRGPVDGRNVSSADPMAREVALVDLAYRCRAELDGGVDELGLAAVFESWGITDAIAHSSFGTADVFALADEVHVRLLGDGRLARPAAPRTPWIRLTWVLRAATYLPPTLFVVIALSSTGHAASGAAFAAVTCFGWGMAEALSRVAYTSINFGGIEAMRDPNRLLLSWGSLVVVVLAGAIGFVVASPVAALLVGAQLQYLLLSVVLLPMGRAPALVFWVTPAMVLATFAISDATELWMVLVVAVICESAVTMYTWLMLGRIEPSVYGAPRWSDLRMALPFLGSGIVMGAFVLCCTAAAYAAVGSGRALLGLVTPLMLSMGLAEIGIRWFQRAVASELGRSARVAQFAWRTRLLVLLSCGGYVVVLLSVDLLVIAVADLPALSGRPADYALLGLVGLSLFLTLVLMTMDHVFAVLGAFSAGTLALGWFIVVSDGAADAVVPALTVSAIVATYLLTMALRIVGHPANHAFT